MPFTQFCAHSIEGKPVDDWRRLGEDLREEHLEGSAELAVSKFRRQ